MKIHTEIIVQASSAKVWEILLDFSRYPEWNNFIKEIRGHAKPGAKLEVLIYPPGGNPMKFKPLVQSVENEQKFSWKGKLLFAGLFDGEHVFEIQQIGPKAVKFIHSETFSGILVPLLSSALAKTKAGFELMNSELKSRAESQPG